MLLTEMRDLDLGVGDVLRLSENYDLKPGSGPVDLIVYDPRDDGFGLGLMVISGYKAGLTYCVFPRESFGAERGLSANWLLENWDRWFRFTYQDSALPFDKATVIGWEDRSLVDHEEPYDPHDMLENARDFFVDSGPSTIRRLLDQPPGHMVEICGLAPTLDLGDKRIFVSWQPFDDDEWAYLLVYFDADTLRSIVSMHTEHWKDGRSEH